MSWARKRQLSTAYIPMNTVCSATKTDASNVSIRRQMGRDAWTFLETLLIPKPSRCVVTIGFCIPSNSDPTKVGPQCNQVMFFDLRKSPDSLLFAVQQSAVLSHSMCDSAVGVFQQIVSSDSADRCTCRANGCPGAARLLAHRLTTTGQELTHAPLNECILSGFEFDADATNMHAAGRWKTRQHPLHFFVKDKQMLGNEEMETESLDQKLVLGLLRSSHHATNLCALDFQSESIRFEEELMRRTFSSNRAFALGEVVKGALQETKNHPKMQCNCIIEYYISTMCEKQIRVTVFPLPTAHIYQRLGDSVYSVHSAAMRELVTKQAVASVGRGHRIRDSAIAGEIDHFDTVLFHSRAIRDLAKHKFGEFYASRCHQTGRVAFITPDSRRADPPISHQTEVERAHTAFGLDAKTRFSTLGSLAIHLGYMSSSERGKASRALLPVVARKCLRSGGSALCIDASFQPFTKSCELNILVEMSHTPNRHLLMARLASCFMPNYSLETREKIHIALLASAAIIAMLDSMPPLTPTLEMCMKRETGVDFFNLTNWWS